MNSYHFIHSLTCQLYDFCVLRYFDSRHIPSYKSRLMNKCIKRCRCIWQTWLRVLNLIFKGCNAVRASVTGSWLYYWFLSGSWFMLSLIFKYVLRNVFKCIAFWRRMVMMPGPYCHQCAGRQLIFASAILKRMEVLWLRPVKERD